MTATPTPAPSTQNALSPTSAFNQFANSAGMQFQNQQAANAVNNLYAAHGQLQSGAAAKAISDYIANQDLQRYFMPYMSMLQGQQNMGASSAAALAGAGTSFGQTATNINSNLANAAANTAAAASGAIGANTGAAYGAMQNGANALSNQAIANGNANAGMWNGIGTGLGQLASSFVQPVYTPSYSGANGLPNYNPASYGFG